MEEQRRPCFVGFAEGYCLYRLYRAIASYAVSIFSRYASSQPARLRFIFTPTLALLSCPRRLSARWRNMAMFWGAFSLRMRLWSSPNVTSSTQCRRFSMPQCALVPLAASVGHCQSNC